MNVEFRNPQDEETVDETVDCCRHGSAAKFRPLTPCVHMNRGFSSTLRSEQS
jgi:hypothetical protein